jgi:hypothetical protein
VVAIKHTKGHELLLFNIHAPSASLKTECFSFQKTETRESRERGSLGETREREQITDSLEEDFS